MSRNRTTRSLLSLTVLCCITAIAPVAAGSVNLSWDPSASATGYKVYSSSTADPYQTGTALNVGNVTLTTFSTMTDCEPTFFQVTAFNSAGESGPSNQISTWPRPTVTGANPPLGQRGQQLDVVISGNNFQSPPQLGAPGAEVKFSSADIRVDSSTWNACGQITAKIFINSSAPVGPVQIDVVNVNDVTGSAIGLFCIETCTPPDTTPPTASLSAPAAGSTVTGSVTVSATASDNVGVVGVQFLLDGAALGSEDTTAPYQIAWDTTTVANGSHTLSARARDAAGNTGTATNRTVTVNNGTLPDVQNLRRTDKQ